MKTSLDCIACFVRQSLEAARFVSDNPQVHEKVLRAVLKMVAHMDLAETPPRIAQQIHKKLRRECGVADPYRPSKDRFTRLALDMLPGLQAMVRRSADPMAMAARMAIAGNVIDLGLNGGLTEGDVRKSIGVALHELFVGDIATFKKSLTDAKRILYLADNAGEIVFDRLLIEQIGPDRVTVVVRGGPIINDATLEDAVLAGVCDLVKVIDNGSNAPGTLLDDCGESFLRVFSKADLIIAKGQGNFETLSNESANIFFLLKTKCPVIAEHLGLPLGAHVLTCRRDGACADEDPRETAERRQGGSS